MAHPPPAPLPSALARHRQLSPTANLRVSPLCLGAMNFGEAQKAHLGECSKETAFEILDTFVAKGGNFLDTANIYQNEESETWIGEWLSSRKNRESLVISTKWGGAYKMYDQAKFGCQSNYGSGGTKSMKNSLEESLVKLQTHYVDILFLHFWDYSTTVPELMHSLNDLVVAGKVHYLGISNTPAWIVAKANQYARDHGLRQFVVYQGITNAANRDIEREIIPMAREEGMGIMAYGALGQGRFQTASSYAERAETKEGRTGKQPTAQEKAVSAVLESVAERKKTSIQNVALAYALGKTAYLFPIVGGRKVEHLKGNIDALTLRLSEEDLKEIEGAYEFDPGFPHTFMSGTMWVDAAPKGSYLASDNWLTKFSGTFDWVEVPKAIAPAEV